MIKVQKRGPVDKAIQNSAKSPVQLASRLAVWVGVLMKLSIFCCASCTENYIDIYESLDCTGYRRARICSYKRFLTYYTFGNTACILYHSGEPENSEGLKGFKLEYSRDDVNECLYSAQPCDGTCINYPGGHACFCPEGYFLAADDRKCFGEQW